MSGELIDDEELYEEYIPDVLDIPDVPAVISVIPEVIQAKPEIIPDVRDVLDIIPEISQVAQIANILKETVDEPSSLAYLDRPDIVDALAVAGFFSRLVLCK